AAGSEGDGAAVPGEDGPDDLLDLIEDGDEEVARLDDAHLREDRPLPLARRGEAADALVVLRLRDLSLTQKLVAEGVAELIRRGEDDLPAIEMDGLDFRTAPALDGAGGAVTVDRHQDLGQRGLPEIGLVEQARGVFGRQQALLSGSVLLFVFEGRLVAVVLALVEAVFEIGDAFAEAAAELR